MNLPQTFLKRHNKSFVYKTKLQMSNFEFLYNLINKYVIKLLKILKKNVKKVKKKN